MALFDDRLQGASDADPITSHNRRILLTRFIKKERVQSLAVFGPEFEYMADLDGSLHFKRLAAFPARLTCLNDAKVRPMCSLDVAPNRNVSQMETIFVGASGQAGAITETFVGKNLELSHADSAQAAGMRSQSGKNLLCFAGPEVRRAECPGEFGFVQLVVTAQQN